MTSARGSLGSLPVHFRLVSYDLLMAERKRAREDGVDPRFRMNNQGTRLMLDLIAAQGKLDEDDAGPIVPKSNDPDDEPFTPAQQKWEAENRVRLDRADPGEVKLSWVKFSSNDNWYVHPLECEVMAEALRAVTPEQAQGVLEADEVEMEVIQDPNVDDPPDMETAVKNVMNKARQFADYCEQAAEYGGFRVS